jgi:small subunit ribosomal protein S17
MAGKSFEGTVKSHKMAKTIVVTVQRKFREGRQGKIVQSSKKYKVHCEDSTVKTGDFVRFIECRPLSREKRFRLHAVLKRVEAAAQSSLDEGVSG